MIGIPEDGVNVFDFGEFLKEGYQVPELRVVHVIEPGSHWDGVVRVEDIRGGRVVHDHDFVQITTQSTQVLDVVPAIKDTGFPEETGAKDVPLVQQVCDRVSVLRQTGRE